MAGFSRFLKEAGKWSYYRWYKFRKYYPVYCRFKKFSMVTQWNYEKNLFLADRFRHVTGAVVECGVWRGGMSAGMAAVLGDSREYYLFDSFQGLPSAKDIDGEHMKKWQADKDAPGYFDNCSAEEAFAREAMRLSGAKNTHIIKGWFKDTLAQFPKDKPIAILRLDGDLFESTLECLENLYERVTKGGLIIIDDYTIWDGCARAVHHFLDRHNLPLKIRMYDNEVSFIVRDR